MLQARPDGGEDEDGIDELDIEWDEPTFEEAVAEMAALAERIGRPALARSADEWRALVQSHLEGPSYTAFVDDVRRGAEPFDDLDQANEVLSLALQIWNATPQPDRGGLSATEVVRLGRIRPER
ncbi:MAG: hypothetical protein O3B31_05165 [Chloroflexi bacterium]|nr:hypothetical protein [Chloroflexota bacterium]